MSHYQEVLEQAKNLTHEEQLKLVEDLSSLIRQQVIMTPKPKRSILELRGLGKEIWRGIDAQEYVNQERDSWNG
jgi:dihydroneopterin aldolase